jgi:citrate lyase subunit beta/citryl-CoA lyase
MFEAHQAVTALFVPGNRPERFAKAAASGADLVIIDLEDAVATEDKDGALAETIRALSPRSHEPLLRALVRINAPGTEHVDTDIGALLSLANLHGHGLLGLMVPKTEDAGWLRDLARGLSRVPSGAPALVPLIESAEGLLSAVDIARTTGVTRLAFGAIDYALDVDADADSPHLDYARTHLVVASRAAQIAPPLDSPCPEIRDIAVVASSARTARGFGFGGKLCIHPSQIAPVQLAFTPDEKQVAWAQSVIGAQGGATQVDGKMIDRPVTEKAKRILAARSMTLP